MDRIRELHQKLKPLYWAEQACEALIQLFKPEELPPAGVWHYHQGVFLLGMIRLWEQTGREDYYTYVKKYADSLIGADGSFLFAETELDSMQAGNILFPLCAQTGDRRYALALNTLITLLDTFHKTDEGGFWHKEKYPNQQWLDGLYMAGPLTVRYAALFDKTELCDLIVKQAELIYNNTRDERSGLLCHAFDASKKAVWADPRTGRAPEFWGRALGWFPAALLDILDYMAPTHEAVPRLRAMVRALMSAISKMQDPETGLWYQVLDKGTDPRNWHETSCTSLFVYALAKGMRTGILDSGYVPAAMRGFEGALSKTGRDEAGRLLIHDICVGTGVGDYEHYLNRPRKTNDLHGVGAFILAGIELERLFGAGLSVAHGNKASVG